VTGTEFGKNEFVAGASLNWKVDTLILLMLDGTKNYPAQGIGELHTKRSNPVNCGFSHPSSLCNETNSAQIE
jgi:hypothetical protein